MADPAGMGKDVSVADSQEFIQRGDPVGGAGSSLSAITWSVKQKPSPGSGELGFGASVHGFP